MKTELAKLDKQLILKGTTRKELITLIKLSDPSFTIRDNPLISDKGRHYCGFRWGWDSDFHKKVPTYLLRKIYVLCKSSNIYED